MVPAPASSIFGYFTEIALSSLGFFGKKTLAELSDEVLVVRYRESGDKSLVGELFKRYTYPVVGVAYKYLEDRDDARDLVMQVFEKLLVDLREHRVEHFKPWLYAVVRNAALMELRNRKSARNRQEGYRLHVETQEQDFVESEQELHLDFQVSFSKNGVNAGGNAAAPDPLAGLENALSRLNEPQKLCVELFYLQKKSYQEVAELTGFSPNQVKSHLQNGKRNLKLMLGEPGSPSP